MIFCFLQRCLGDVVVVVFASGLDGGDDWKGFFAGFCGDKGDEMGELLGEGG